MCALRFLLFLVYTLNFTLVAVVVSCVYWLGLVLVAKVLFFYVFVLFFKIIKQKPRRLHVTF